MNNIIKIKNYSLDQNILISSVLIIEYLRKFWNEIFSEIIKKDSNKHLMILVKVKISVNGQDSHYKTLGPLRRVEFKDLELFENYLIGRLGILIDSYDDDVISEIIFSYIIKEGLILENDRLLLSDLSDKEVPFHSFNKIKLPVSTNPNEYGTVRGIIKLNSNEIRYFVRKDNRVYEIDINTNELINKVRIIGSSDLNWVDTQISEGIFKREIGKGIFYFMDGEPILIKRIISSKPFACFRNK